MAHAVKRLVLITGGTRNGVGYEVGRRLLAGGGTDIVLTFRDENKSEDALKSLRAGVTATESVSSVLLDLASFASIRSAAKEILEKHQSIDVLVCNAGIFDSSPSYPVKTTEDGWDLTYQTNHLGHFLLVHLLLPALLASKAPGGGRIVLVSSELHRKGMGDLPPSPHVLHNITKEGQPSITGYKAYSLSKLCNLWFCYKLSTMLKARDLKVTVDAVTPGWVPSSNLGRSSLSWWARIVMGYVLPLFPFSTTLQEGSRRVADVVSGPAALACSDGEATQYGSGRYFSKGMATKSSDASYDEASQDQLWRQSCEAIGIHEDRFFP